MFIRKKVVKGTAYYQIVETVRDRGRVRQNVRVALGTTANPREALAAMKRELKRFQKLRWQYPANFRPAEQGEVMLAAKIARWDAWIVRLESRIDTLAWIIWSGEL